MRYHIRVPVNNLDTRNNGISIIHENDFLESNVYVLNKVFRL